MSPRSQRAVLGNLALAARPEHQDLRALWASGDLAALKQAALVTEERHPEDRRRRNSRLGFFAPLRDLPSGRARRTLRIASGKSALRLRNRGGITIWTKVDSRNPTEPQNFTYSARDELVQVTKGLPGSETILGQFDYNHEGNRVRHRYSDRGDVDYFYDDGAVIEERNASDSSLLAYYQYADRLIALVQPAGKQYYHHDAMGSTIGLTDAAGNDKKSYHLDPWGNLRWESGTSDNRHIFTGKEHDKNTGLVYFGARYYDPETGRFITQDSYLGESNQPPSLHRYLYAYSNPTVFVDRRGNAVECVAGQCQSTEGEYTSWDKSAVGGEEEWNRISHVTIESMPASTQQVAEGGFGTLPSADGNVIHGVTVEPRNGSAPDGAAVARRNRMPSLPATSRLEDKSYYMAQGPASRLYQGMYNEVWNDKNSVGMRISCAAGAAVTSIGAFFEETFRAFANTPAVVATSFENVGEHTAQAVLLAESGHSQQAFDASLKAVSAGAEGFVQGALPFVPGAGTTKNLAAQQAKNVRPGVRAGGEGSALGRLGPEVSPAARGAGAGKTVLGKFPDYVNLADDLAARRFSIPTKIWNKMTPAEQWAANRKFLDRMISRGDEIILSNPVKNVSEATGWFGRELNYLVEQGFRLSADGTRMIR